MNVKCAINPLRAEAIIYSSTSSNMKSVHWPLMGGLLHLVQRGGVWAGRSPPRPLLAVPNVTAHTSTASVRITVLLYNGPLLCGFNVSIKGSVEITPRPSLSSLFRNHTQRLPNIRLCLLQIAVFSRTCRKIYFRGGSIRKSSDTNPRWRPEY